MSTPFLGEIKMVSFNFPPKTWAFCNGQQLPINQNQALFSILGTTYGGNGQTTFALPDLRGRTPISFGSGHNLGEAGGNEIHTVTLNEMPSHIHPVQASTNPANAGAASGNFFSASGAYAATVDASMLPSLVTNAGGSQPHQNMSPYLAISFCIALQGIFPSRN